MTNSNINIASYKAITSTGTHNGLIHFDEVPIEDVPFSSLSYSTSATLESGKAYYMSLTGNATFTLPAVSDNTVLHSIIVMFDTTHASTAPNVQFSSTAGVRTSTIGATIVTNKVYTASCVYRPYYDTTSSDIVWTWVVTVTEDF